MDLRIGTWNTRTLYRTGALRSLLETVDSYRIDILAFQEMRWVGQGTLEKRSHTVYYSCSCREHIDGVGFVESKRVKDLVVDFETVNARICCIRMKRKFFNYIFINAYAPMEDKLEVDKEEFYEHLGRVYRRCPRHDVRIVMGDMNAKIGREQNCIPTIGKQSLHEESNDNELRLVNCAVSLNMTIACTCFEHKNIHKVTWVSPDGRSFNR
jgi:exonuclease III